MAEWFQRVSILCSSCHPHIRSYSSHWLIITVISLANSLYINVIMELFYVYICTVGLDDKALINWWAFLLYKVYVGHILNTLSYNNKQGRNGTIGLCCICLPHIYVQTLWIWLLNVETTESAVIHLENHYLCKGYQ